MKAAGDVLSPQAELLSAISDLLREELSHLHGKDIARPVGRAQHAGQEISVRLGDTFHVLQDSLFRDRIGVAIDAALARHPSLDDDRLASELGRSRKTLSNWRNKDKVVVRDVPFAAISRLSELSGYPIGWFNGEISDEEAGAVASAQSLVQVLAEWMSAIDVRLGRMEARLPMPPAAADDAAEGQIRHAAGAASRRRGGR